MNSFYRSDSVVGSACLEYEYKISKLKRDYCYLQEVIATNEVASLTAEIQQCFNLAVEELRIFFNKTPELASIVSSLYVVPTVELPSDQRLIHRIWLGGSPPFEVNEAVRQWFSAINEGVPRTAAPFRQVLWVWQKEQIQSDVRFRSRAGAVPCQLGEIVTCEGIMQVNSLQQLLGNNPGSNEDFIHQLHQQRYYATLSDYFRLLILIEYGGVYMDADTLPYKPVSWFLFKPEIPAIKHFPDGNKNAAYLSWLNLFLDETGMIVAAKGEPAIADIFMRLNQAYAGLESKVPAKSSQWERQIFEIFYVILCEHWTTTFISHDIFCQRYAVFSRREKEEVLCGVRGMRLLEDIISGEHRPLSATEKSSHQRAVMQLEAVDWKLNDALELEQFCEVYHVTEVPHIAYSLQMRSDIEHFHYYNVLSEDPALDRVNTLFGHYLLESNSRSIASGNFWQPVDPQCKCDGDLSSRSDISQVIFAAGSESTNEDREKMARLIFSTSYLEYCSVANPRQMDIVSLQRAQNIDPWLSLITAVFKPSGDFAGFFTAGPMAQFKQTSVEYLYREEMLPLDRDYDRFVEKNSRDEDYFIASLALEATEQRKGYFRLLMEEIERQAIQHTAVRITLCVWESSRAISLYKKRGFRQSDSSDRWQGLFADRLCFLEKEISVC